MKMKTGLSFQPYAIETGAGFWIAGMPATDVGVSETEGKIYPSVVDMI